MFCFGLQVNRALHQPEHVLLQGGWSNSVGLLRFLWETFLHYINSISIQSLRILLNQNQSEHYLAPFRIFIFDFRFRFVSKVDIETNEAFPDRETNPTDFDKLEGYNPNRPRICSPKQPGQINARPGKWGLGTVQKNSLSGVLRWPFWGPIHHLPKATLPCWKNTW